MWSLLGSISIDFFFNSVLANKNQQALFLNQRLPIVTGVYNAVYNVYIYTEN